MVAALPLHRAAWDGGGGDSAPLSPELVAEFEEEGVILVRSPLSESELDDAEAAWHELIDVEGADKASNPGFIRLISHPFFERVAQQLLRSEDVRLAELGPRHRPPTPEQPQGDAAAQAERWAAGAHLDIQITTSDFQATPRRDLLAIWFWISDVTPERAAMRPRLSPRPLFCPPPHADADTSGANRGQVCCPARTCRSWNTTSAC